MSRIKRILIPAILLITIVVLFVPRILQDKEADSTSSDPIERLINHSLSIQYGTDDIDVYSVFTEEFIVNLDQDRYFDKTKLAPYHIIYRNSNLLEIAENEYVVSVHIEDKDGRYIQILHIIKEKENYRISKIEYDI